MTFEYTAAVNGQMRQWIANAIARSAYPWDGIPALVTFDVQAEPPAPGHKDVMCTVGGGGAYTITIRAGVDQPTSRVALSLPNPAQDVRTFFQECVVHELAHVVTFVLLDTDERKSAVAAMLERNGATGDGTPAGELEDWNDPDYPWEDRVVEGVAEIIKDVALPSRNRVYDNRTNWEVTEENFPALLSALSPQGEFEDHFPGDALDPGYGQVFSGEAPVLEVSDGYVRLADVGGGEGESQVVLSRPDVIPGGRTILEVELDWPDVISDGHEPGYNAGITIRDDSSGWTTGGIPFIANVTLGVGAVTPAHGGSNRALYLSTVEDGDIHSVDTGFVPVADFGDPVWLTLEERDDGMTYAGLWSTEPPEEGGEGDLAWLSVPSAVDVGQRYLGIYLHTQSGEIRSNYLRTEPPSEPWTGAWPYEDPTISGGQGESGVMRFAGR